MALKHERGAKPVPPCTCCRTLGGGVTKNGRQARYRAFPLFSQLEHGHLADPDEMCCAKCYERLSKSLKRGDEEPHWCYGQALRPNGEPYSSLQSVGREMKDAAILNAMAAIKSEGGYPTRKAVRLRAGVAEDAVNRFQRRYPEHRFSPSGMDHAAKVLEAVQSAGKASTRQEIAKLAGVSMQAMNEVADELGLDLADAGMPDLEHLSVPDAHDRVMFYRKQFERKRALDFSVSPWAREYRRREWA